MLKKTLKLAIRKVLSLNQSFSRFLSMTFNPYGCTEESSCTQMAQYSSILAQMTLRHAKHKSGPYSPLKIFWGNLLTLNMSKTKYIHFHGFNKRISGYSEVRLEEEERMKVDSILYLGIKFDSHLTFQDHIDFLC